MNNDDINDYLPSILNPRGVKKLNGDLLTQDSVVSRCSLSLKRRNGLASAKKTVYKPFHVDKENSCNNNNVILNPQHSKDLVVNKSNTNEGLRLKNISAIDEASTVLPVNQKNDKSDHNVLNTQRRNKGNTIDEVFENSLGFSAVEDLNLVINDIVSSPFSFGDLEAEVRDDKDLDVKVNCSFLTVSSATDINENVLENSNSTIAYDVTEEQVYSVSFGVNNCDTIEVGTKNSRIKNMVISHMDNKTNIDCEIIESSIITIESDSDAEDNAPSPPKKLAVAVNLEFKKKEKSKDVTENSKVLILNTDAIEKLSHVIVQPPNYKLVKRKIFDRSKFKNSAKRKLSGVNNGKCVKLKQNRIDCYLNKSADVVKLSEKTFVECVGQANVCKDAQDMSKNLSVGDAVKSDRIARATYKSYRKENEASPRSIKVLPRRGEESPKSQSIRISNSEARRAPSRGRNDSASSHSPRKNVDSLQFSLPSQSRSNRNSVSPRRIPYYKIVAGTHFAVDAFSYGDIPNVKHYFLTHFHSDHYSGLKKGFSKLLFCSKITADLCITRLGVSPKCIHIINSDETLTVEGVEVTAMDANHCPGALMLVFMLPNGKTLLHTGDFRASPQMESYPIFWNKDIHTVYLDTTYCNPRYDFPTQDQSLEMALYLLRQKKLELEKNGKKFSSVLIVCGTYTIGKEKFFLGMAKRVGCSVWACPEKDRVLQAVEGRSFGHAPPHSCQLHVVPMRDLTHEKLRSYLDSLQGSFSEVVAFKPSGWENGKNSSVEKNLVTIHGIPYSEHSSFSELIRFVKYLKPKQVVPTVDISGGIKSVQKYFPCPLLCKEDVHNQSKLTDYFSIQNRQQLPDVT